MEPAQLVEQARRIIADSKVPARTVGALAEGRELTRTYAGEKSAFYRTLQEVKQTWSDDYIAQFVVSALEGFIRYLESGLLHGVSVERKAKIDVVSDFLDQSQRLLDTEDVHPAAPAVLIGASLEEFLRNWAEEANLTIGSRKPGIDAYSSALRAAELITKQDSKDITAWAGIRNHAAHGEWGQVDDRDRIRIMLEGINLFMRKYAA